MQHKRKSSVSSKKAVKSTSKKSVAAPKPKMTALSKAKRMSSRLASGAKSLASKAKSGAKRVSAHAKANKKAYGGAAALAGLTLGSELAYRHSDKKKSGMTRGQVLKELSEKSGKYAGSGAKRVSEMAGRVKDNTVQGGKLAKGALSSGYSRLRDILSRMSTYSDKKTES